MSVRFVGPYQWMGPVPVDDTATIKRGHFVRVDGGEVKAIATGSNANLAVALDKYPDDEYEGTKARVDLGRLGEDCEIEVPFETVDTAGILGANIGNTTALRLHEDSYVDLDSTTNGVFRILRLGRDTKFGDMTGFVVGVVNDAASF